MYSHTYDEDQDLAALFDQAACVNGSVVFTKDVLATTRRYEGVGFDLPVFVGKLKIQTGTVIPASGVSRGPKRRPCRLCSFGAPMANRSWVVTVEDVPEDSFEQRGEGKV